MTAEAAAAGPILAGQRVRLRPMTAPLAWRTTCWAWRLDGGSTAVPQPKTCKGRH